MAISVKCLCNKPQRRLLHGKKPKVDRREQKRPPQGNLQRCHGEVGLLVPVGVAHTPVDLIRTTPIVGEGRTMQLQQERVQHLDSGMDMQMLLM
jgi:hypothetical protein